MNFYNLSLVNVCVIALSAWGGYIALIKLFHRFKAYQPIYDLSPEHHQKKTKTPTMGGVVMTLGLWGVWLWLFRHDPKVTWVLSLFTSFSFIGGIDDILALIKKKNKGLTATQKFILQCVFSCVFIYWYSIYFSGLDWWHYIVYTFVIVGASNATNLTDGLDGLLGGCSVITLCGFFYIMLQSYDLGMAQFIIVVITILSVFLLFNWHPASLFMGDVGSLGVGALFAGLAIIYADIWVLIPLGAVYILETLSVIVQVGYYKLTKKRVFLMAPLHHHFELLGLKEIHVVMLFYAIALSFSCWVYS